MKYATYSEEDFIMDEYFQKWILEEDCAARNFWENWLNENPEKKNLVENAADFIRNINLSETDRLSEKEVDVMFEIIDQKKKGREANAIDGKFFTFYRGTNTFWAAASCVGLIVSVLAFNLFWDSNNFKEVSKTVGNEVMLKLEDGTVQVLNENASKIILNSKGSQIVNQDRNLLIYDTKAENFSEIKYNELVVPYGKKFELRLSDGSHVHLNSGSKLRYPMVFKNGSTRTVYLDGEAYFSIEKDSARPFIVVTEDLNTKVYGTKFNMSSYKNEKNTATVLIEGSVAVYQPGKDGSEDSRTIVPGERAKVQNGKISVDSVNVKKYVAWTEGRLLFTDDRFEMILKKLERHFNVVIDNKLQELNNKPFTGTFTEESIDQIFRIFQEHTPFKYSVKENAITIYKENTVTN